MEILCVNKDTDEIWSYRDSQKSPRLFLFFFSSLPTWCSCNIYYTDQATEWTPQPPPEQLKDLPKEEKLHEMFSAPVLYSLVQVATTLSDLSHLK